MKIKLLTNESQIKMLEILRNAPKNKVLLSELRSKLGSHYQIENTIKDLIILKIASITRNSKKQVCLRSNVSIKNYDELGNLEVEIDE